MYAWKRHGGDIERPVQPHKHIWEAWAVAQKYANSFDARVERIKSKLSVDGCTRPQKIKSVARIFEKMLPESDDIVGPIPLDLLGGKLIFDSLDMLYKSLLIVSSSFKIRHFKDRFLSREPSGYCDIQFIVEIEEGHLAELKLVHRVIDSIDFYEHRVYEILRGIDAQTRGSGEEPRFSESIVSHELKKARKEMYAKAWHRILEGKGED